MTAAIAPSFVTPRTLTAPMLLNLLIVESDRYVRDMCREVASEAGFRASSAESPEQALRMLESLDFELLLLGTSPHQQSVASLIPQFKARRAGVEVIIATIAEGGTVFLDEVAELPVDLQAKMLRALQEKRNQTRWEH